MKSLAATDKLAIRLAMEAGESAHNKSSWDPPGLPPQL